jgi:hypothetical protein
VTTDRLVLREWVHDEMGPADGGGSRPPRRAGRGWADADERAGFRWVVLVWLVVLTALIAAGPAG